MAFQNRSGSGQNGTGSGSRPPSQPIFNSPPVVTWMIGIMAGIWLLQLILPSALIDPVSFFFSFVPARLTYDFPSGVPVLFLGSVTYQFLHADFTHMALNSVWMLIFGTIVARRIEFRSFVAFFIVCGVIGAAVHLLVAPGSHIPVKDPQEIKIQKPDYILILAWNFKDEIMEQLQFVREWGRKFIIPIPKVEIV